MTALFLAQGGVAVNSICTHTQTDSRTHTQRQTGRLWQVQVQVWQFIAIFIAKLTTGSAGRERKREREREGEHYKYISMLVAAL